VAAIADEIAGRFGIDAATVAGDSGEFLAALVEAGLVQPRDPGRTAA